jgi:hypothetical protein
MLRIEALPCGRLARHVENGGNSCEEVRMRRGREALLFCVLGAPLHDLRRGTIRLGSAPQSLLFVPDGRGHPYHPEVGVPWQPAPSGYECWMLAY